MKKQIYQAPHTCAVNIIGKALISASMTYSSTEKVSNSQDIGFVKEESSQAGDNNVWNNEW